MTLDQALFLLGMLTDTVESLQQTVTRQAAELSRLQAELALAQPADSEPADGLP